MRPLGVFIDPRKNASSYCEAGRALLDAFWDAACDCESQPTTEEPQTKTEEPQTPPGEKTA